MVLHRQLEVGERDRDERGHDDEDDEDDEEDGVDGVHLVAPHARKDVVELDVDGAEGQEPGHGHLGHRVPVPRQDGDLTGVLGGAAGGSKLRLGLLPCDPSQHEEREGDERPDEDDDDDGAKGLGVGAVVRDGDGVEEAEGEEEGAAEEKASEKDVAYLQEREGVREGKKGRRQGGGGQG